MRVYADNAATTYMSKAAKEKFIECIDEYNGNPNSLHSDGQRTQEVLDEARAIVAGCINAAKPNEIYFTSGATESNNTAIFGAAKKFGKRKKSIVTSAVEHPSVNEPLRKL
ncbi:MAG: aminotransferase class V-fold PLP-dependent enzyme, partial [Mogibacterium sp.]|nr:aminotransferase class V-fold PLP-dependent enzyme [Mogibacterium sp.]